MTSIPAERIDIPVLERTATQEFSERLTYAGRLTVVWEPGFQIESADWLSQMNAGNLNVLNVVATMHEHRGELTDDSPLPQELMRLDAKLNLLLDLVGNLVAPSKTGLSPVAVRFNAFGISWQAKVESAIGSSGLVTLYLDAFRAKPLLLPAVLVEPPHPTLESGWTSAIFHGLSEPVLEVMERLVFRYHRRQIAESRQATKPQE